MSAPAPIALVGAGGRMGAAVERALVSAPDLELVYRADPSFPLDAGPPRSAPDLAGLRAGEVKGIIDFSSPDGVRVAAEGARRLGCALVSGTTGIEEGARVLLREVSKTVPVCWSPNFSIGAPLLAAALRAAARLLPPDWQLEVTEVHHAGKRDAPSGTAIRMAEGWRQARGGPLVHGRHGITGPRAPDEVGMHALRLGDVVGEHRLLLGGAGEVLEGIHRVQDRSAFARGCIEALRRLMRQGPGWYEWDELLIGS